jgi:hypothetical protein
VAITRRGRTRRTRRCCAIRIGFPRCWRAIVDIRSPASLEGVDQIFKCRKTCFVAGSKLLQQPALVPSGEKFCGQATQPLHRSASCGRVRNAPAGHINDHGVREPPAFVELGDSKNELRIAALSSAQMLPQNSDCMRKDKI